MDPYVKFGVTLILTGPFVLGMLLGLLLGSLLL
jgi:hypothetical protein